MDAVRDKRRGRTPVAAAPSEHRLAYLAGTGRFSGEFRDFPLSDWKIFWLSLSLITSKPVVAPEDTEEKPLSHCRHERTGVDPDEDSSAELCPKHESRHVELKLQGRFAERLQGETLSNRLP